MQYYSAECCAKIQFLSWLDNHILRKTLRGIFRALGCCHGIILYTEGLVQRLERPTLTIKVFIFRIILTHLWHVCTK